MPFPPIPEQQYEDFEQEQAAMAAVAQAPPNSPAPRNYTDLVPNQFGDRALSSSEAAAACGPAAAVAFARAYGRNPTLREAVDIARNGKLWDTNTGMYGPGAQQQLLASMGIPARLEPSVNWDTVQRDVQNGNPVIIDTPGHYYVASGYNPETGQYYFGASGTVYKNGGAWMTPEQLNRAGAGAARAALYSENGATPNASVAAAAPTNGVPPSGLPPGVNNDYVAYARQAAQRAGIDPELFVRQINQESGFNPHAKNPSGATGIAQIVPKYHPQANVNDPYASLDYAANLMASHLRQYGSYEKALAAYNGGGGAVQALEAGRPYGETQAYLGKILTGATPPPSSSSPSGGGVTSAPPAMGATPDLTPYQPSAGQLELSARVAPLRDQLAQRMGREGGYGAPMALPAPSYAPITPSAPVDPWSLPAPTFAPLQQLPEPPAESAPAPEPVAAPAPDPALGAASYDQGYTGPSTLDAASYDQPTTAGPPPTEQAPAAAADPWTLPAPTSYGFSDRLGELNAAPPSAPELTQAPESAPDPWTLPASPAAVAPSSFDPSSRLAELNSDTSGTRVLGMPPSLQAPAQAPQAVDPSRQLNYDATPITPPEQALQRAAPAIAATGQAMGVARDVSPSSITTRNLAGEEQIANESRTEWDALQQAIAQYGPDSPEAQQAADAYNARSGALRQEGVYNVAERNRGLTGPDLPIPVVGHFLGAEGATGLAAGALTGAVAPGLATNPISSLVFDPENVVGTGQLAHGAAGLASRAVNGSEDLARAAQRAEQAAAQARAAGDTAAELDAHREAAAIRQVQTPETRTPPGMEQPPSMAPVGTRYDVPAPTPSPPEPGAAPPSGVRPLESYTEPLSWADEPAYLAAVKDQYPLYDMPPAELSVLGREAAAAEHAQALRAFGNETDAARYTQLSRARHTSDPAEAEFQKLVARLSPEQALELERPTRLPETAYIAAYHSALSNLSHEAVNPQELGRAMARALLSIGDEVNPQKMTEPEQFAYAQIRHALSEAQQRRWDPHRVSVAAMAEVRRMIPDPVDAEYMLQRFQRISEPTASRPAPRAIAAPAAPRAPEPGAAAAPDPMAEIERLRAENARLRGEPEPAAAPTRTSEPIPAPARTAPPAATPATGPAIEANANIERIRAEQPPTPAVPAVASTPATAGVSADELNAAYEAMKAQQGRVSKAFYNPQAGNEVTAAINHYKQLVEQGAQGVTTGERLAAAQADAQRMSSYSGHLGEPSGLAKTAEDVHKEIKYLEALQRVPDWEAARADLTQKPPPPSYHGDRIMADPKGGWWSNGYFIMQGEVPKPVANLKSVTVERKEIPAATTMLTPSPKNTPLTARGRLPSSPDRSIVVLDGPQGRTYLDGGYYSQVTSRFPRAEPHGSGPTSPVQFVENGQVRGAIMPMHLKEQPREMDAFAAARVKRPLEPADLPMDSTDALLQRIRELPERGGTRMAPAALTPKQQFEEAGRTLALQPTDVMREVQNGSRVADQGPGTGGLVILKDTVTPRRGQPKTVYNVVHVDSGLPIHSGLGTLKEARIALSRSLPFTDWTQGKDAVVESLKPYMPAIRRIGGDVYADLSEVLPKEAAGGGAARGTQPAQANPLFATRLASAAGGAALGQVGTDENTSPGERVARGVAGAAVGLGLGRGGEAALRGSRTPFTPGVAGSRGAEIRQATNTMFDQATARPPVMDFARNMMGQFEQKALDNFAPANKIGAGVETALSRWRWRGGAVTARIEDDARPVIDMARGIERPLNEYIKYQRDLEVANLPKFAGQDRLFSAGIRNAADAQAALDDLQQAVGPQVWQRLQAADARRMQGITRLVNDKVAAGVLDPQVAQHLLTEQPHYNPTRLDAAQEAVNGANRAGKFTLNSNTIRRLTEAGHEGNTISPLETYVSALTEGENAIQRNRAVNSIVDGMLANPDYAPHITRQPNIQLTTGPLTGGPQGSMSGIAGLSAQVATHRAPVDIPGTISRMKDGVREIYAVPPDIEKVVKNLQPETVGFLGKLMGALNTPTRVGSTTLSPYFLPLNIVRDTVATYLIHGPRANVRQPSGWWHALRNELPGGDPLVRQLQREGLGETIYHGRPPEQVLRDIRTGGGRYISSPQDLQAFLPDVLSAAIGGGTASASLDPNDPNYGRDVALRAAGFGLGHRTLVKANRVAELGTRVAIAQKELARGGTMQQAAFAGGRGTLDFSRMGEWTRALNPAVMFLGANVGGTMQLPRMLNPFRPGPGRTRGDALAADFRAATLATAAVGAYLWNRQFPEYADVRDSEKNQFLTIMLPGSVPDPNGPGYKPLNHIAIPLGEAALLTRPLTAALEKLNGENPHSIDQLAADFFRSYTPGMPRGEAAGGLMGMAPGPAKALVENATNTDAYTGSPIIPRSLETVPRSEQQNDRTSALSTSPLGQRLGELLHLSPLQMDHLVRSTFGSAGSAVLDTSNIGTARDPGGVPVLGQVAGRIVRSTGGQQRDNQQQQYDEAYTRLNEQVAQLVRSSPQYQNAPRDLQLQMLRSADGALRQDLQEQVGIVPRAKDLALPPRYRGVAAGSTREEQIAHALDTPEAKRTATQRQLASQYEGRQNPAYAQETKRRSTTRDTLSQQISQLVGK